MKAAIQVENKGEAEQIRRGIEQLEARAVANIMGILATLPTPSRKQRVVKFIGELLGDSDGAA
jgi:hypothetical protein